LRLETRERVQTNEAVAPPAEEEEDERSFNGRSYEAHPTRCRVELARVSLAILPFLTILHFPSRVYSSFGLVRGSVHRNLALHDILRHSILIPKNNIYQCVLENVMNMRRRRRRRAFDQRSEEALEPTRCRVAPSRPALRVGGGAPFPREEEEEEEEKEEFLKSLERQPNSPSREAEMIYESIKLLNCAQKSKAARPGDGPTIKNGREGGREVYSRDC